MKFPFGKEETFLENEIDVLAAEFDEVHIFPMNVVEGIRKVPTNVKVHYLFDGFDPNQGHLGVLLTNISAVLSVFFHERKSGRVPNGGSMDKLHYTLSFFGRSKVLQDFLKREGLLNAVHYTFWYDLWATCLTFLKFKSKIRFYSRAHGFDLYEERGNYKFIHFRELQLKKVETVFLVSNKGQSYLQGKYPDYKHKIKTAYLGTLDNGISLLPNSEIMHIVSCSNVIQLKRVEAIVDILGGIKGKVDWVHFGDGPLLEEIKKKAENLPENIACTFKGRVENKEVLRHYKSTPIDLFINLSETEGLPVSIMEAISFGIPVIATNVGGTSEIVCENTGWLIEKEFTSAGVRTILEENKGKMKEEVFRNNVRKFWENNFNAEVNYKNFAKILLKGSGK